MKDKILAKTESLLPQMVSTLGEMVSFPAVSPDDGGEGEYAKAQFLLQKLNELGFDNITVHTSPDPNARGGGHPNIVFGVKGRKAKRLWFVAHIDVVPEGDRKLWNTDPFNAVIKDGRIYGRGTSDNGQSLVASLYALYALKELGITPEYEICLALVSNEEVGSEHGIKYLIQQNLFRKDDLVVVPDMGSENGDMIEIAEKTMAWLDFTLRGKQVHASTPELGINACRAANEFCCNLDNALHAAFPEEDKTFIPPCSTFEPTRRSANVPNVNTVPGIETFSFDCRLLPSVSFADVKKVIDSEIKKTEEKHGVKITFKVTMSGSSQTQTPSDAPVVKMLIGAIKDVFPNVKPQTFGIGGGTCAAFFRAEGIHSAVWGQNLGSEHMPNEFAVIEHLLNEAKVFALMMAGKK
ncbi:MAG: M20 family metallo-hydrolase [Synergistes sp.]|nr:M20 family metallo-hydrolase [Synergistes sp.]